MNIVGISPFLTDIGYLVRVIGTNLLGCVAIIGIPYTSSITVLRNYNIDSSMNLYAIIF
jgi:hypothetical protein